MTSVTVVGSGASGVHFALSALERGCDVTMIDVGFEPTEVLSPDKSFSSLKDDLDDPVEYFLGDAYGGVVRPDSEGEYYGFPPSKSYVFQPVSGFSFSSVGFSPLFSFARGGLAQAWTAGCYPFNDHDLAEFPFSYADLEPYYVEVARRIGVTGIDDDLSRFLPLHDSLMPPLELDAHSQTLLDTYARVRGHLNRKLGCYLGRTRVATLSRDHAGRKACDYLGRCLWGCPIESIYTPSQTLRDCMAHPKFTYHGSCEVTHFLVDDRKIVNAAVAKSVTSGKEEQFPVENLVLAAGTLCSSKIFLRSVYEATGATLRLRGLMDNRQVLMPFVNLRLIGRPFSDETYQYHLLGFGLEASVPQEYVHGQITTLKTAQMHPIIQSLPLDSRTSSLITRSMHAALGVVNWNFHDTRREGNYVTLRQGDSRSSPELEINYAPAASEERILRDALRRARKVLRKMGCLTPPGMTHIRPMGASVHYAGTLPMSRQPAPWTTDTNCRSHDFPNLYVVDGSTFPFLPSKNITFTLMANATRVASNAF